MKEKDIQSLWGKWIRNNWSTAAAFELKLCKGLSIAFDHVAVHQIAALRQVKNGGLYHKLKDTPVSWGGPTRFTNPAPFDCFVLAGAAYVVVCFYVPRVRKTCYMIEIDRFLAMKEGATRKSMTEEMANAYSYRIIEL